MNGRYRELVWRWGFQVRDGDGWSAELCGEQDHTNTFLDVRDAEAQLPALAAVLGVELDAVRVRHLQVDGPAPLHSLGVDDEGRRLFAHRAEPLLIEQGIAYVADEEGLHEVTR